MEPSETRINGEPAPVRRVKRRKTKRVVFVVFMTVVSIVVLTGAFFTYKYFFPSDKQLFSLAHYNTFQDRVKAETVTRYAKTTDVELTVGDGVTDPQMAKALNGLSAHTDYLQQSETQSRNDFTLKFMGGDLIAAKSVKDGGVTVFSSPQMADAAYAGNSTGEILSVLLNAQGVNTNRNILEGVDREGFSKFLKKYGLKLYSDLPNTAFSSVKINGTTTVRLSAKAVQLFSGIVGQLRADSELKSFLYTQRQQIVKNMNEVYEPSALLLSGISQSEFDRSYLECLDSFLANMAHSNAEVELTAKINKHRRVESETLKISIDGVPAAELALNGGGTVHAAAFKEDGSVLFRFEKDAQTTGTVTNSVTSVLLDTAQSGQEPKTIQLSVTSATNQAVPQTEIHLPEQFVELSSLSMEERQGLANEVNQRLTGVFTRAALGFLMFR